uniref:Uncharacterized protein n=1 Tax=Anguilla anguilla TaxID=7936 RepID=A0A0E9VMN7_ANGAN
MRKHSGQEKMACGITRGMEYAFFYAQLGLLSFKPLQSRLATMLRGNIARGLVCQFIFLET